MGTPENNGQGNSLNKNTEPKEVISSRDDIEQFFNDIEAAANCGESRAKFFRNVAEMDQSDL